jgi:hypothetical protein
VPAERAIDLADVARIKCDLRRERDRAFHQRARVLDRAAPKRHDAGEMQRVRMLRRDGPHPREQSLRVVEAPSGLVLGDQCESLRELHRLRGGRCGRDAAAHAGPSIV